MPTYSIWSHDDPEVAYWVWANSPDEARRLIFLNVPAAREATDSKEFRCTLNMQKKPPEGVILTNLNDTIKIERR